MCFTKKVKSNTRNKRKPLQFGKENESPGELAAEQIRRLQNDLGTQTALNEELCKQLNDLHKLVNECHNMIQKQNAKIKILENESEHEKKKNLSGSENSDTSQDKT